jgi:dTDP-L-rhamnose 4-epimerase
MSLYGEGLYRSMDDALHTVAERELAQLRTGDWELHGPEGDPLIPVPTPESKPPSLASVYALSKFDQERMCLIIGRAYDMPTTALRFFNVYGTRQALSNPYTGVLAIFAARLLNGNRPLLFEDGGQRRDFVSVLDVARACCLVLEHDRSAGQVFNIGSGRSYSIGEIAERFAAVMERPDLEPEITGKYRVGDIRHCFADISRAAAELGYQPQVALEDGLVELAEWLEGQAPIDRVEQARAELTTRGLTV